MVKIVIHQQVLKRREETYHVIKASLPAVYTVP